jgi:hypothetical protein
MIHREGARRTARQLIAEQWVGKRFTAKQFSAWVREMSKREDILASKWDFHKAKEEYRLCGFLNRVSAVKGGPSVIFDLFRQSNDQVRRFHGPLVQELGAILKNAWPGVIRPWLHPKEGRPDGPAAPRPATYVVVPDTETKVRSGKSVRIELAPHSCAVERKLQIAMKALEEVRQEDGAGADQSPAGTCYHIAKKALQEIEEIK